MGNKELFNVVIWFPIGLIIIGSLTGLLRFKKLGATQRLLLILLCVALCAEIVSLMLRKWSDSSYPVFHVYAVIEYWVISLIYALQFQSKWLKKSMKIGVPVMVLYSILNVLLWQPLTMPNTNVTIASSILFISVSVFLFFYILTEMRYAKVEKSAVFWFNIGVVVYFTSSLVLFVYMEWLMPLGYEYTMNILLLNIFFNTIHYLCFNIALWMKPE